MLETKSKIRKVILFSCSFIMLVILAIVLLDNNTSPKPMTQQEEDILLNAFMTNDLENQINAQILLDNRIQKYHQKGDYANKVQLLLLMKEFQSAYETTEEILERYPDYIEIQTIHCVLAKKVVSTDQSNQIYTETNKRLQDLYTKKNDAQFNILSSQLVLSILYSENTLKEQLFNEIIASDFDEYEKEIITEIYTFQESELYAMFGIQ